MKIENKTFYFVMALWNGSESGILRKNKPKENFDDLLVFGYACKIFRDDEKALYIDQGKHLIPWMGDESIKIDRYDGRGAISDISRYEASREGYDAMRWLGLQEHERKLEQLCDEERYYSLRINEEEEQMYKEEEFKRKNTNEFAYNYDVPAQPEGLPEGPLPEPEPEDEEYVPPPNLDVPVDISIPKTMKQCARIEKTALFVNNQGPQLEILIKAKQSDNPQFSFLNQHDPLYKFYRHVLGAIKSGRYKISETKETKEEPPGDDAEGHYLHPSLSSLQINKVQPLDEHPEPVQPIPSIPYKPSADCAYSQLVNRIQGSSGTTPGIETAYSTSTGSSIPFEQMTYEQQQQYYQYYMASQYYEYCVKIMQYQQQSSSIKEGPTLPSDFQLDANMRTYIQQMVYTQHNMEQHEKVTNNPYAQIVSNVNKEIANPYTALLENIRGTQCVETPLVVSEGEITRKPVIYREIPEETRTVVQKDLSIDKQEAVAAKKKIESKSKETLTSQPDVITKKTLSLLTEYGSDSEEENEDQDEDDIKSNSDVIKVPTGDTLVVIDRLAAYVAKNGVSFEKDVMAKNDPRFGFLYDTHEYFTYYKKKLKELGGSPISETKKVIMKKVSSNPKEKKVIAPVCFSIKKHKEETPKELKSALPLEESDDDEEISPTNQTDSTNCNQKSTSNNDDICKENITEEIVDDVKLDREDDIVLTSKLENTKKETFPKDEDPIFEMIDIEEMEEKKESKRAEDKIKDKLAAVAREKCALASKDRALQQERKRKALAFLKLKTAATIQTEMSKSSEKNEKLTEDKTYNTTSKHSKRKKENSMIKSEGLSSGVIDEQIYEIKSDDDDDYEDGSKQKHSKKKSHKRKHSKHKHSTKKRRRSRSSSAESKNSRNEVQSRSSSCR